MPSYTLGEMMSLVTFRAGRRVDLPTSRVSEMVNEAYFEVWDMSDPKEGEEIAVSSTTTGENKIELPTDFSEPISATLIWSDSTSSSAHSSYRTLDLVSAREMDSKNPQPSGTPTEIAFYNSWLELYPSPNSAFSLQFRYRAGPTDMTSTGSIPSIDTPWRPLIVTKAEAKALHAVGDFQGEAALENKFLRDVSRLKTDRARRQSASHENKVSMTAYGNRGRRKV